MRGRRAVVVAVAAWVLVVAVGSTLVWAVISRAGEGVVAGGDPARTARPLPSGRPGPPSPPTSAATSPSPVPPPPVVRRGTWQGGAGVVVAECRRSAIRLVGAYPNSGWSMRVVDRGPQRVVISFAGGDDRGETGLGARCVQGTPAYAVTGDGSGDG